MKFNHMVLSVVVCVLMSLTTEAKNTQTPEEKHALSQAQTAALNQYFSTLAEKNKVLGAFAIYQSGKKLFDAAYVVEGGAVIKSENKFRYRIGSVTKTFTATLVFQMIEKGLLGLDTPLSDFFPEVPNADQITIKMMLNHHSGLFNYTSDESFHSYYDQPQSKEAMVKRIESLKPAFEPGQKGEYSNSNYLLLGYILEQVSQKDYGELIAEYITEPLGLKQTYLDSQTEPEKNEVFSYGYSGEWNPIPSWDMSTADAAGALVSTTHDLNVFVKALFDGELISPSNLKIMTTIENTYGHGIFERAVKSEGKEFKAFWHNGRIERFTSMMAYFPELELGVTSLHNADIYDGSKVFKALTQVALGASIEMPEFKDIELSEKDLSVYIGEYSSETHPLGIKIMTSDGQLMAQAQGQGAFPLTPVDHHVFEFMTAGIEMTFDPDHAQFVIKQGGRADIFVQKGHESTESKVSVDEKTLLSYEGVYHSEDFPLDLTIRVDGGELKGQATGQPEFPLNAESDTEFTFDLAGIVIQFDAGQSQLTITQRGVAHVLSKK